MSKTISWPARVTYLFIALALALSLVLVAIPAKTDADPGLTKWSKVTTPTDSNETIIQGSDIYDFAIGPDGDTIYAIGKMPDGRSSPLDETNIALWKSTDGGATWSDKTDKLLQDKVKLSLPAEFDTLVQVAVAPNDEDFVMVAGILTSGDAAVVGSTDGATKFYNTDADTKLGSTGIICMDVSRGIEDIYNVALGTDAGKVWRYEAGTYWGGTWTDATTGDYAADWQASDVVTSVIFSPSWSADKTVLAISTNTTSGKTWLQSAKWGETKGWGAEVDRAKKVEFKVNTDSLTPKDDLTSLGLPTDWHGVTGITLPSDYHGRESSLRRIYAYVDTWELTTPGGYLFRIDSTTLSIPCGPTGNPWLGSIAYYGDHDSGDAMLGMLCDGAPDDQLFTDCCAGVQVWRTDEIDVCCPDWKTATKKPSGQAYALVAFTPDGKKAYATTVGEGMGEDPCDESAFSVSLDKGKCWNQLGLIDTDIDYLSDVAVSPDCCVTYLSSMNVDECPQMCDCDSVWAKDCDADYYPDVWQRVYHKELDGCGILRLSPEHDDGDVVYWGAMGTEDIYWAISKGICKWSTKDAPTIDIQDFALADDDTLYVINDEDDLVKWTEAKGDWTSAVDHKAYSGHTIAVLGDNVLVGGSAGSVGYSDDAGDSFSRLGDKAELGSSEVHVALDSYFKDNDTIYAALNGGDQGIWRWVIDDSSSWDEISAGCAEDINFFGIVLDRPSPGNPKTKASTGGVLYAAFYDGEWSGVARCLTPASTPCCSDESWDCLTAKLTADEEEFTREPSSLKICGCLSKDTNSNLFAIDDRDYYDDYDFDGAKFTTSAEGRLWTYEDCFAKAGIDLTAVGDGDMVASDPCICANDKFVLEWERLCNACEYEFDISMDEDFNQIVVDEQDYDTTANGYYKPPKGSAPSVVIGEGDIDCNTTYYWRVRAHYAETDEIIQSWWSDTWSFTVEAGPSVAIDLTSPDDGATNLPLTGIGFTWSSVADATSYDWVLSANADLSSPVETKTGLTGTAYTYTGTLKTNTTYFWRVTAMKDGSVFSEGDIGTFTTAPAPIPPPPPPPAAPAPTTPAWVWVVIGIGAVLVIVVIVLIFRTRRV